MSDHESPEASNRIFRRTALSSSVEILLEGPGAQERCAVGSIVNVGLGGVLARVDEGMAEGALCTVRFAGPESRSIERRGFVRRTKPSQDGGILVGIEFESPIEMVREAADDEHLEGFDLSGTKILVVDDEPSIVELLYRFLTSRGCVVTTAESGTEALEALRKEPPDITVLDLKMPGMGGLEVLEKIRAEALDAGKVWAVSGYASDEEARQALNLGAADFINKPLDLKYLEWSMQLHHVAR